VVDDDIDIRDPNLVNWALSFRVQPEKDAFILSGTAAVQLDPSQAREDVLQQDPTRRLSSKIGIDATRKHEFPAVAVPPQEHLDRIRNNWSSYGF
jgi:UbiD family decarboxylase